MPVAPEGCEIYFTSFGGSGNSIFLKDVRDLLHIFRLRRKIMLFQTKVASFGHAGEANTGDLSHAKNRNLYSVPSSRLAISSTRF